MSLFGFSMRMLIGPVWKKRLTPEGGTIRGDFERLLELEFEHLIPGHGSVRRDGARKQLRNTVAVDLESTT